MKKIIPIAAIVLLQLSAHAQILEKSLPEFRKVVFSPFIDVELRKGTSESIKIVYENVREDEINIEVNGKTLRVYLDDAKLGLKRTYIEGKYERKYARAKVKAVVTYRELRNIQMAGNNRLTCKEELTGSKLKIKIYDEAEVNFTSMTSKRIRISTYGAATVDVGEVKTNKMRIATYGDNDIKIESGEALNQIYRAYGDNIIDARGVQSSYIKVGFFGDNKLAIDARDEVKLTVLGEGNIRISGDPHIRKNLILGSPNISSL